MKKYLKNVLRCFEFKFEMLNKKKKRKHNV